MSKSKKVRISLYLTERQFEYIQKKSEKWKTNTSDAVRTMIQKNLDWDEGIRVRGGLTFEEASERLTPNQRIEDAIYRTQAH